MIVFPVTIYRHLTKSSYICGVIPSTYTFMKKIAIILIASIACIALHAEERHITFGELPKESKVFILTHFKDSTISEMHVERSASLTQYAIKQVRQKD